MTPADALRRALVVARMGLHPDDPDAPHPPGVLPPLVDPSAPWPPAGWFKLTPRQRRISAKIRKEASDGSPRTTRSNPRKRKRV